MSTLATSSNLYSAERTLDIPVTSSPKSQTHFQAQQVGIRPLMTTIPSIRGQTSPFPLTPTSAPNSGILEPPAGLSHLEFVRKWTDSLVARWLAEIKCGVHAAAFRENDIRGDILLELDQTTLQEMGVSSVGDRLRILNAVKILRQKCATKAVPPTPLPSDPPNENGSTNGMRQHRRLESGRPAPLMLNKSRNGDLPRIVGEVPDSARSISTPNTNVARALPSQPATGSNHSSGSSNTPLSVASSSSRPGLPPALPVPSSKPPPPPSNRTTGRVNNSSVSTPSYTNQTVSSPYTSNTPSTTSTWYNSNDPRSGRSASPLPPANGRPAPPRVNVSNTTHARNNSMAALNSPVNPPTPKVQRPSTAGGHPYASAQTLHIPNNNRSIDLSPISENYSRSSSTPSPPNPVGVKGGFTPSHNSTLSEDKRKKLVKFFLPDEGITFTIDVENCVAGVEVIEKLLKKYGMGRNTDVDGALDNVQIEKGGLSVDGWGVYKDESSIGPLNESELLAICHSAPDHPTRQDPLILRQISKARRQEVTSRSSNATKRASAVSILTDLGVHNPERALEPASPLSASKRPLEFLSPGGLNSSKRGGKLRNFFGQRPPSELISTHLQEFFPNAEKKILQRTARQSMMRPSISMSRRESTTSMNPSLPSRFSSSTMGTKTSVSPTRTSISSMIPQHHGSSEEIADGDTDTAPTEELPRVSISTEGAQLEKNDSGLQPQQLLPPIPFPTESFSESMENLTGSKRSSRRMSRASVTSRSSRRLSYMTEIRSKRDRSDTASLMTVDEITAEVESRRASQEPIEDKSLEDWTNVEDEDLRDESASEVNVTDVDYSEEEEEETTESETDGEEGLPVDAEDEEAPVPVKKAKWIRGALIGAGSFGKVYLGMDASSGLLMAVKQVELPSGANAERKAISLKALEHEIELLQNLQHDNIVQYLYSSHEDDCLNIFLEYVPGGSVAALLRNYGAFEETLVKNFVRQILHGLNYLHERDIIHRDIKGANILVDNKGGVKISDFGISKKVDVHILGGSRGHRPSLQGSVFWMAPEVVKQDKATTPKADIWSVGCLIVEMLTGEHPWAHLSQMQAIFKIGSFAKPTVPSDISKEAQDFLMKTFELDHDARPSAPESLAHAWLSTTAKS